MVNFADRKCASPGCRNAARHHRTLCNTCRARKWDDAHPFAQVCRNLKKSAKKRGIFFDLRPEDLASLPAMAIYGGWSSAALTIDRIEPAKGYVPGNLQVITRRENAMKYHAGEVCDFETAAAIVREERMSA